MSLEKRKEKKETTDDLYSGLHKLHEPPVASQSNEFGGKKNPLSLYLIYSLVKPFIGLSSTYLKKSRNGFRFW